MPRQPRHSFPRTTCHTQTKNYIQRLEGLLLLNLSRGGGGSEGAEGGTGAGAFFSLTPRARLQLPSVPIQAGFLDGDLIVALPSASSAE